METVRQELLFVSELHTEQNTKKRVHGERLMISVTEGDVEAILYRGNPNSATIICAYGGGFIMGGCAIDDHMWTTVSSELGVNILSVGYRKGPEYSFPTALYDVYHALCWFVKNKEVLGIKSDKIAVMGASAGGNLAAATAILDRIKGTNYVGLQILNYPYLDLDTDPADKGHPEEGCPAYRLFPEIYVPTGDRRNPLVSPIFVSDNLENLPPAYITVAGADPLCAEGTRYYEKLREAGVMTELATAEGMPHGYLEAWFNLSEPGVDEEAGYRPEELMVIYENGTLGREAEKTIRFIEKALATVWNCLESD